MNGFPKSSQYWPLWPLPEIDLVPWPPGVESWSDRNRLVGDLKAAASGAIDMLDLDPHWAGYWMLSEPERRSCMGVFFDHLRRSKLEGIFSEQVLNSLEMPPPHDPRFDRFLSDKEIYVQAERGLIHAVLSLAYITVFSDEDWRYRDETLEYWSG